jgi:hypothetical protein
MPAWSFAAQLLRSITERAAGVGFSGLIRWPTAVVGVRERGQMLADFCTTADWPSAGRWWSIAAPWCRSGGNHRRPFQEVEMN